MAPAAPDIAARSTCPAAGTLTQMAVAAGSQVVLYQTWGHQNGNVQVGHSS